MLKRTNDHAHHPDVSPRTREILTNEKWYGNGPPQWRIGKKQRPSTTAEDADDERRKLVRQLRRYAHSHPGADITADRLDNCALHHHCHSGACPECGRAFTRWFVSSASALLDELGTSISVLSLVHADLGVPVGDLTPEHVLRAKRKVNAILNRSGITTFIGGIDVSSNEHKTGEIDPHFQLQSWVLAPTDQIKAAERQIRKLFPRTETTPRPVKVSTWDGNLAAFGYALKKTFDRRVSIICDGRNTVPEAPSVTPETAICEWINTSN